GAPLHLPSRTSVLAGDALIQTIMRHGITHATLTPGVLAALPEQARLDSVHTLILAGDITTGALVKRWAPGRRLINAYGPTEATVWATLYECDPQDPDNPPIGRPISNARIYILDGRLQPSPVGTVGEIYIGGAGVGRGYLGRPDLTAERFIPLRQEAVRIADCGLRIAEPPTGQSATTSNTSQEEESAIRNPQSAIRVYRTGDLGRWRADGTIEFLGRNDFQVKIRGFRIELGEIEARLSEHPGVRQAVVLAQDSGAGDKRLVAYYTEATEEVAVTAESLRTHLRSGLPEYM